MYFYSKNPETSAGEVGLGTSPEGGVPEATGECQECPDGEEGRVEKGRAA